MANARAEGEHQTLDLEHELPPPQPERHPETRQESARAALPAEATSQDAQQLHTERDSLLDRLARLQSELEDLRKQAAKEQEELGQNALLETLKPLLPVLDSFEQAVRHTDDINQFRSGVRLIYRQLMDALKTIGVRQIPLEGKRFNPHYQEAIQVEDASEAEDNQILEVLQPGYMLNDRLLRPARVRVGRSPRK
jgi:molecular chaperone GrpE